MNLMLMYLMAALVDEIGVSRLRDRDGSMLLPPISLHRACPQDIIFRCPPDGDCVLRAFPVYLPQLSDGVLSLCGLCSHLPLLIKQPFWVIVRPQLNVTETTPWSSTFKETEDQHMERKIKWR